MQLENLTEVLINLQINYSFRIRQLFKSFVYYELEPKLLLSLQLALHVNELILLAAIMPFIIL
jgi:hypothetical protein